MAASPRAEIAALPHAQEKWTPAENGGPPADLDKREPAGHTSGDLSASADLNDRYRSDPPPAGQDQTTPREKQIKLNKVYIGNLPESTRREDLQHCFGEIGNIVNIELKLGYGFVEFDTVEAAKKSVAKYHEGFFMGQQIRVELSHGGGRTAKYNGDPGACFKCGMVGHWARECPNHSVPRAGYHEPGRDYPPPPPRDLYRDEYSRYPPPRDHRYGGYDYPPRDYRRPASPPRDYRDYPAVPRPRDYDDYRMRPPAPPPGRPYYPPDAAYPPRAYESNGSTRDVDRAGRVAAPPPERYSSYSTAPVPRPRTPPGPPPARARDEYDRPPRDYPASDYRGRAATPPLPPPSAGRYSDYPPPRTGGSDQGSARYRRRSQSPPPRSGGSSYRSGMYTNEHGPDTTAYPPASAPTSGTNYTGNGYSAAAVGAPPRGGGSARDRDYSSRTIAEPSGYPRRA